MMNEILNPVVVGHGLMAIFGALVHALNAYRRGQTKSAIDFLALTIMSSFTGVIFGLVAVHYMPDQPHLTTALAGTGGWLGIEGMSILVKYLQDRFLTKQN